MQALAFDAHRRRSGNRLQKGDAIWAQFFQVARVAAVGQQQYQQAHRLVMPVAQANADQVNPRALQRQQHLAPIPGLFEPQTGHHGVDFHQLPKPGRTLRRLRLVRLNVECGQILGRAVDHQAEGNEAVTVIFPQVDQAGLGLADIYRFKQYALQQRAKAGLGAEAVGDLEETGQGVFHARHRHAQLVHFKYR